MTRSEGKNPGARYRPGVPPTLFTAVGFGVRAALREPWLLAVGLVVGLVRRAAVWPAIVVAWAVLLRSVALSLAHHPFSPAAPVQGALATVSSPRFLALVAGLWLAGLAAGAALRVAYLAGALPTLGGALAGVPGPRFAAGVAFGFPRVLAAAALGLVLEVSAGLFGATLAVAAGLVTAHAAGGNGTPWLAAAVALALVLAIAVPVAMSIVADAAVARAALRAEDPGRAFAESGARFLARPGTFVLCALAFGIAGWLAPWVVAGAGAIATGFASAAGALVLAGPQLMVALTAALVAAAIDLVGLGTVAALACGETPHPL